MSGGNSAIINMLTPVWQRVLHRPQIGPADNFFELGGNPKTAARLFSEIAHASARVLPPEMIYQAPTIATLARVLEDPNQPRLHPLVLLKDGDEQPPVFIAHGLGGSVMEFFDLVNAMQTKHPIYGMQARGNDGVDAPFERVEPLAQYYLDALKQVQPQGPYFLVGYSLGGLIMLEVAQRLAANREEIGLLVMIDTYPHPSCLSLGQRLRLTARRVRRFSLSPKFRYPRTRKKKHEHGSADILSFPLPRAYGSGYSAWVHYEPHYYSGTINFVRAETFSIFPNDPEPVWGKLAKKLEIETTPGDHHGMIATNFEPLAALLAGYIAKAAPGDRL